MGKNGICQGNEKKKDLSLSDSSELTDSSSDNLEFIIDFMDHYYMVLERLDLGFIIEREPMEDLIITIIDFEIENNIKMDIKKFEILANHFHINSNILLSKYLTKKNKTTL